SRRAPLRPPLFPYTTLFRSMLFQILMLLQVPDTRGAGKWWLCVYHFEADAQPFCFFGGGDGGCTGVGGAVHANADGACIAGRLWYCGVVASPAFNIFGRMHYHGWTMRVGGQGSCDRAEDSAPEPSKTASSYDQQLSICGNADEPGSGIANNG